MHESRMDRSCGKDDMSPRFLAVIPEGGCRAMTNSFERTKVEVGGGN